MAVEVSIIIPAYKAKEYLRICLNSIKNNMPDSLEYEVIVVEDHGEDGSLEMLYDEFKWATILHNEVNSGLIQTRLNGVAVASGEFIFLIDSDIEMFEGTYKVLIDAMRDDERLGFVTCNKKSFDGTHQRSHFDMPNLTQSFLSMIPYIRHQQVTKSKKDHQTTCDPGWISPGHSLIRRSAWDDVGGQSPQFFFYGEEIDFCYKLRKKKWHIRFLPHMGFIHYGSVSQQGDKDRFRKMSWLGALLIADLYWPRWQALVLRLLFFIRAMAIAVKMILTLQSPWDIIAFSFRILSPNKLKNNHLNEGYT